MTREEAEQFARERLTLLAQRYGEGANEDWNALALAARAALAGDRTAAATFRRVFDEPGFAVSNSCMEVGYAAIGLALCGEIGYLDKLRAVRMPFNGIDAHVSVACVLLTE
jgi:hypothetical protein